MKEIKMFKCDYCGKTHGKEVEALKCEFEDAREKYANKLLNEGYTLSEIKYLTGFSWPLLPEQELITKDSCFMINYWQCCNKPAYRITYITKSGLLELTGSGSWVGVYSDTLPINKLTSPYPLSDLYVYGKN